MHLLLLHGAIGSSEQLLPLALQLKDNFTIHQLNFSGHGGKEITNEDFSIGLFAKDVLKWMDENTIETINIFGYSMGGYVALYLARFYPEKVGKVFTLATKINWTPEIAEEEIKLLNPEKIIEKLPAFAQTLAIRHSPADWKLVLKKTADMMLAMGVKNPLTIEDYKLIPHKIICSVGDSDKMVTLLETVSVCANIKNATLIMLPITGHLIETVNLDMLVFHIKNFLQK